MLKSNPRKIICSSKITKIVLMNCKLILISMYRSWRIHTPDKTLFPSFEDCTNCTAHWIPVMGLVSEQANNFSEFKFWHVLLRVQASYLGLLVFQHLPCKTANTTAKSIESMPLSTLWVYWYLHLWYKRVFWEPPFLLPGVCFHGRERETRQLRGKEAALVLDLLAQLTEEQAHHQIEDIDKEAKFIWNH